MPRIGRPREMESGWVVARTWGKWVTTYGYEVSVLVDEVPELNSGDGCTVAWLYWKPLNVYFKRVNFMPHEWYFQFKKAHWKNVESLKPLTDPHALSLPTLVHVVAALLGWFLHEVGKSLGAYKMCGSISGGHSVDESCCWYWGTYEEPGMLDILQCLGPSYDEELSGIPTWL